MKPDDPEADEMRCAKKCPQCGSTSLYQEIVEYFLSDEKTNNFRCYACRHEWSEQA